jgi:hypothetical protein
VGTKLLHDDDALGTPLRQVEASLKMCTSNCVEGVDALFGWVSGIGKYFGRFGSTGAKEGTS